MLVDKEFKELVLSDEKLRHYIGVFLFYNFIKGETEKGQNFFKEITINDFKFYNWHIYENEENKDLKESIESITKDVINENLINDVYYGYIDLINNESKGVLYALSRLLYMQDKHKNNAIPISLDNVIKEIVNYINTTTQEYLDTLDLNNKNKERTLEEVKQINKCLWGYNLSYQVPSLNYDIYNYKNRQKFTTLWREDIEKAELKRFYANVLNNFINDANTFLECSNKINETINDAISSLQFSNFLKAYNDKIKEIKEKHQVKQDDDILKRLCNMKIDNYYKKRTLQEPFNDEAINNIAKLYLEYVKTKEYQELEETKKDIKAWRNKADLFIKHLEDTQNATFNMFDLNYTLNQLAYNDNQRKDYKTTKVLNDNNKTQKKNKTTKKVETKADDSLKDKEKKTFLQATSKQIKAIDNARGGLVTYTETDTQAIRNEIKHQEEMLKNISIKSDKEITKQKILKLKQDLKISEEKEKELKEEYKNVCDYLAKIIESMANLDKFSDYYKDLKKRKKEQEKRKKELERIIQFNGWQLDIWGNGNYELMINKRKKESLKLTIENLSKQIAKYTKEEQDIFDYLINKYLHNTEIKEIKFTLREYENVKGRVRPSNNLTNDIQAIRLLFREIWTYYTTDNKTYTFNEEHLFTKLHIKGELVQDTTDLNNANLDTEISLEPTETLQTLLQDHDNYLYISTPKEILQLNNDNEYLAKRLIKYLNYLARVEKNDYIEISLDKIIEELQHYGLKHFNFLDRHKTYKTEIVDVIEKCLNILEGENHIKKQFIEVLDRQPFINYDTEFRGKSQETSINEWGKHKLKVKIFNLDNNKLIDTKKKSNKKKKKKDN